MAALNAVPGLLGAWRWYRCDERAARFWVALRVAQVRRARLRRRGRRRWRPPGTPPANELFYLYALLPLAIGFVAEQLRVASAQTILDQRDLADAQAVGGLPEDEQQEIVARSCAARWA